MTASLEREGTRSSSTFVTFDQSFQLGSDPRELPSESYAVHTVEHLFSRGDHQWATRGEVTLEVVNGGTVAYRHVDPGDLERALASDAAQADALAGLSENPDRGLT